MRTLTVVVLTPGFDHSPGLRQRDGNVLVQAFLFHALRHSGASVLEQANVPIGSIQRILGHENRTTTEIYLHSLGDSEREAMRVFEAVRAKVPHSSSNETDYLQ